jgi:hypothetical protein
LQGKPAICIAFSITLEHPFSSYHRKRHPRGVDAESIGRQLMPLLMTHQMFEPGEMLEKAWKNVSVFFTLTEPEAEYSSLAQKGELRMELLFPDDPDFSRRIAAHPALLWKISNIRTLVKKQNSHNDT